MSSHAASDAARAACALCTEEGGALVWRGAQLRVIRADEPGFPAFYRVVWNAHVAEFTDLQPPQRAHCMQAVALVEEALRAHLAPTKINLAALGNQVPHLHWHVIARFAWDSHFPAPSGRSRCVHARPSTRPCCWHGARRSSRTWRRGWRSASPDVPGAALVLRGIPRAAPVASKSIAASACYSRSMPLFCNELSLCPVPVQGCRCTPRGRAPNMPVP
jgi:Diadenosine tetraphosphate (Ap4A) hydrolase and other HIT family hydrolases